MTGNSRVEHSSTGVKYSRIPHRYTIADLECHCVFCLFSLLGKDTPSNRLANKYISRIAPVLTIGSFRAAMAPFTGTLESISLEETDIPTVMIVGKSGAGKSTLGNYLLYGMSKPDGGFKTVRGVDRGTTVCSTKTVFSTSAPSGMPPTTQAGGPLAVIDTPGIPDALDKTMEFYDNVVMTARESAGLNALIFAIHDSKDRQQIARDCETYRVLLAQFAWLPCLKILFFRVKVTPGQNDEQRNDDFVRMRRDLANIQASAGLETATRVHLYENGEQPIQLFGLRQAICEALKVPIPDWGIRTHSELRASVVNLATASTRAKGLENEKTRLIKQKALLEGLNEHLGTYDSIGKRVGPHIALLVSLTTLIRDVVITYFPVCSGVAAVEYLSIAVDYIIEANERQAIKIGDEVSLTLHRVPLATTLWFHAR